MYKSGKVIIDHRSDQSVSMGKYDSLTMRIMKYRFLDWISQRSGWMQFRFPEELKLFHYDHFNIQFSFDNF